MMFTFTTFLGLFCGVKAWAADRQDLVLGAGWKFIRQDVALNAPVDQWTNVTIPHTWNTEAEDQATDKADPHMKSGYYRGPSWYHRSLEIPANWQGKRVFIRFEAASLVSKTYLNGQLLGEHRGGMTAFCYELTSLLHFGGQNELRIQVDNTHVDDVPPLDGDFNVDGGIYRPVHLLVTDPVCISPLEMASPGVYLTTTSLTDSSAEVEVKTLASNGTPEACAVQVKTKLKDANGKVVATASQPVTIPAGQTIPVILNLTLNSPHRWNGRIDPYLYHAQVSLVREGVSTDSVTQPFGLRTVEISEEKGFLLNGQPYAIHGVNRHQDWGVQGWAATNANMDQDLQMILDMGVTAIRLAHYPQSDYWHDQCDQNGLLLWNEVSQVDLLGTTPEFAANADQQLREMILQRYNHPSVVFWGLFNELHTKFADEHSINLLKHLKKVIEQLDSSRLIVAATNHRKMAYNQVPDHLCFNNYPGWYGGLPEDMTITLEQYWEEFGKRVGISEYGAGANTDQHQEGPAKKPFVKSTEQNHPEEWQTYVHERDWIQLKDNLKLWGTFIWVMFDFQVARRHEGGQSELNDKGMVTKDRQTKKDVYFFYQANWTTKPMVYISSRRLTHRLQPITEVKVFSNCEKVELTVDGNSLGAVTPNEVHVFRWPAVNLQSGLNHIKVIGTQGAKQVTDECDWTVGGN